MSFVSRLRMANMFPINSDLGSARINESGNDPIDDIINKAIQLQQYNQPGNPPSGLQTVGNMVRGSSNIQPQSQPMRFGGIVDSGSNPGADILNRSKINAERLYNSYSQPAIQAQDILGYQNEQFPTQNPDFILREKQIEGLKDRELQKRENAIELEKEKQAGREALATDKNKLNQDKLDFEKGKFQNKEDEKTALAESSLNAVKTRASETMGILDQLLDPKSGQLTDVGKAGTGYSGLLGFPYSPFTQARTGRNALGNLKSRLITDVIGEMKNQSRTGATGFGQMNMKELGILQDMVNNLDPSNTDENYIQNELGKIRKKLELIFKEGKTNTLVNQDTSNQPANNTQTAPPAPEGWEYIRNAANNGWTAVKKGGQ